MEPEQKPMDAPVQKKGCGCSGGSPNITILPETNITEEKKILAGLIKAVHERKSKISKNRFKTFL